MNEWFNLVHLFASIWYKQRWYSNFFITLIPTIKSGTNYKNCRLEYRIIINIHLIKYLYIYFLKEHLILLNVYHVTKLLSQD